MRKSTLSFSMTLSFLLVASSLFSVSNYAQASAHQETFKFDCELVTRPPEDENYSADFFDTKIEIGEDLKIAMNIGELDVFGSCGKENIGNFNTATDSYTEDPSNSSVSFQRDFMSPIHDGVPMWEKTTFKKVSGSLLPNGKMSLIFNVRYDHSCQKYIDFEVDLTCTQQ